MASLRLLFVFALIAALCAGTVRAIRDDPLDHVDVRNVDDNGPEAEPSSAIYGGTADDSSAAAFSREPSAVPTVTAVPIEHHYCTPNPCGQNFACEESIDGFTCICDGNIRVDNDACPPSNNTVCSGSNPCGSGTCIPLSTPGEYICDCGSRGVVYNEPCPNILACDAKPCKNGGLCIDLGNYYICNCLDGFEGLNCELALDSHSPLPPHPSTAGPEPSITDVPPEPVSSSATPAESSSQAPLPESPCKNNPCKPGVCIPDDAPEYQPEGYYCLCGADFSTISKGYCVDKCQNFHCHNNGECAINSEDQPYCVCPLPYAGVTCDEILLGCNDAHPCLNGGVCIGGGNSTTDSSSAPMPSHSAHPDDNSTTIGFCECPPQWEGVFCQTDVNECLVNTTCKNGGICNNLDGDFECECPIGWDGKDCSILHDFCDDLNPCQHGTCFAKYRTYWCACDAGYIGVNCETQYVGTDTISLRGNSFVKQILPEPGVLDVFSTYTITLKLKAKQPDGLIFYADGNGKSVDYFSLELVDGQLVGLVRGGNSVASLLPQPFAVRVDDSQEYEVTFSFHSGVARLKVASFVVTKSIAAQAIYLTRQYYFGGVEDDKSGPFVTGANFQGCLSNVVLNGVPLQQISGLYGKTDAKGKFSNTCPYDIGHFNGSATAYFYPELFGDNFYLDFVFRTTKTEGTIFATGTKTSRVGQVNILAIGDGHIFTQEGRSVEEGSVYIADGQWHSISISDPDDDGYIWVSVDDGVEYYPAFDTYVVPTNDDFFNFGGTWGPDQGTHVPFVGEIALIVFNITQPVYFDDTDFVTMSGVSNIIPAPATVSFPGADSYMRFVSSTFAPGSTGTMSFDLRTGIKNQILFVSNGQALPANKPGAVRPFWVVEILDGDLTWSFNAGNDTTVVRFAGRNVADLNWHSIQLSRNGNQGFLTIDNLQVQASSTSTALTFTGLTDLYVGGSPANVRVGTTAQASYQGCMKDITINGAPLRLDLATRVQGAIDQSCDVEKRSFDGTGYAWFAQRGVQIGNFFSASLFFRTQQTGSATLLYAANPALNSFVAIVLHDGNVQVRYRYANMTQAQGTGQQGPGQRLYEVLDPLDEYFDPIDTTNAPLNDGNWHEVSVSITSDSLSIDVDHGFYSNTIPIPSWWNLVSTTGVYFAGTSPNVPVFSISSPLNGCIQDIVVNGEVLQFTRATSLIKASRLCKVSSEPDILLGGPEE